MLRAYYAWKNGLPFSYVNAISGATIDARFNLKTNKPVSRRDLIDNGGGIAAIQAITEIGAGVSTATYRIDPAIGSAVLPDFYSPKIQPGSIHAGTTIYDINGHVVIVYEIAEDGRILYMDADPDHSVSRSVYGPQIEQSPERHGGGFKNFRPLKLVGAARQPNGAYIGGHMVVAPDRDILDFSLEQYRGNTENADGDGPDALFQYDGTTLGYFEYVRASMSGGNVTSNPVYELKTSMLSICNSLQSRETFVAMAIKEDLETKPQPLHLPSNIYDLHDPLWEAYSTPSRDADIRNTFAHLYVDMSQMMYQWQERDPRIVYDGASLKEDLRKTYSEEAAACNVTYTNSAGAPVTIGFDEIVKRLFAIDFDPYHCVERRWGATSLRELASCKDDAIKLRWYDAEQELRNQAERRYTTRPDFTLLDLEHHALGSGTDTPPAVDIKAMIDNTGGQIAFTGMHPVGF